jgi:hypothetical protein
MTTLRPGRAREVAIGEMPTHASNDDVMARSPRETIRRAADTIAAPTSGPLSFRELPSPPAWSARGAAPGGSRGPRS